MEEKKKGEEGITEDKQGIGEWDGRREMGEGRKVKGGGRGNLKEGGIKNGNLYHGDLEGKDQALKNASFPDEKAINLKNN